ncbi:MAG: PASTA domain-containing protein [candidate division WOR-3 bacterium]|nr:PASTA domain-containing protein [candidate division WOR-3 bacterium]MCX7757877.1 PASTA domain-containing protein [candidate division WOR-3 bacterium]MDW7987673.1 PASTA domain-containing protein [candidate division WOR-3 bacterium]
MKRAFILIAMYLFGFVIGFALIGLFFMPMLSKPAQDVKVPNVIGLSLPEAETIIKKSGLTLGVLDSTVDASTPAGYVIKQKPLPDKFVKLGRSVHLLISKGPPRIRLPRTENIALDKYLELLGQLGFRNITVESLRSFEIPIGQIIKVIPEPNWEYKITEPVTIYVSGGEHGIFLMPRLIGLKLEEAVDLVVANKLILEEVIELPSNETSGTVLVQYPEEGMKVKEGDRVTLTVSKKRR